MKKQTLVLATRASKLAMIQAEMVKQKIQALCKEQVDVQLLPLTTKGDVELSKPLYELGGKGVFIKEIEQAVLDDKADIAVHSFKDITSNLAPKLALYGFLKPEGFRDVVVYKDKGIRFEDIPQEALIATGSLRRKALLKYFRPDIQTCEIRGNVLSRIEKIQSAPNILGTILSEAGLIRLNLGALNQEALDPETFVPAPGQGVIALETRTDNHFAIEVCKSISDSLQAQVSELELYFLKKIGLDCKAPLGLHLRLVDDVVHLRLFLATEALDKFLFESLEFPYSQCKHEMDALVCKVLSFIENSSEGE